MNNLKSVEKTFLSIMDGIERIPDKSIEGNVFWCKNDEILFYEDNRFNVFVISYDVQKIFQYKNHIIFEGKYPKRSVLELVKFFEIINNLLNKHYNQPYKKTNVKRKYIELANNVYYSGWKNINTWMNKRSIENLKDQFEYIKPSIDEHIHTFAKQTVHYKEGMTISYVMKPYPEKEYMTYEISFKDNENEIIKNYIQIGDMLLPEFSIE